MIAETIAQQLGLTTFGLLGAHTLVDLGDGLQFRIKGCPTINLIQIILDPCDTYTVKFCKLKAEKRKNLGISYTEIAWSVVGSYSDIYFDMLHDLIEQETGLHTCL
jgi:hypothetical protein